MISENLLTIILNYLNLNKQSKFYDLRHYNLDYNENDSISFKNFKEYLPLAIGIHLNKIKREYINSLSHIKYLNISNCYIKILPKELFVLRQLRTIYCSYNQVAVIPSEIGNCKKLQKFICNSNQITTIPAEIENCVNLRKFDCDLDEITNIPLFLNKFKNFDYINKKQFLQNL